MASANQYDVLMRDILQAINTLPEAMTWEGHTLWRSEGCQAVARWADLLPYLGDLHPGDVALCSYIKGLCIELNQLIEEDCK